MTLSIRPHCISLLLHTVRAFSTILPQFFVPKPGSYFVSSPANAPGGKPQGSKTNVNTHKVRPKKETVEVSRS